MDDNYSLWQRKEAEAEKWLAQRPECADCGEHIQDDGYFYYHGNCICRDCMDSHWVYVEDYTE